MARLRWPSISPRMSSLIARSRGGATLPWNLISNELALWRREGLRPKVWWRDDDVTRPSHNLDRLLELRRLRDAPLFLAAIPAKTTPELALRLRGEPDVHILVHGLDHSNRMKDNSFPKSEFPAERADGAARAGTGLKMLRSLFDEERVLPIFVPPWYACGLDTEMGLRKEGFLAISKWGLAAAQPPLEGVKRINVHIDLMVWRPRPTLASPENLIHQIAEQFRLRRETAGLAEDPFGINTHHQDHDEPIWSFFDQLLGRLAWCETLEIVDGRSTLRELSSASATGAHR